jgi:uncharacterized iron-regulated membrane protein
VRGKNPAIIMTRTLLLKIHRILALSLGGYFAMVALTGAILVWDGELDQLLNPDWFAQEMPKSMVSADKIMAIHLQRIPEDRKCSLVWPYIHARAYSLRCETNGQERESFYTADEGRLLGSRPTDIAAFDSRHIVPTVYNLHRHLLIGQNGYLITGILGFAILFILVSGLIMWWPSSRTHWRYALKPQWKGPRRKKYSDLHRFVGGTSSVLIMVLVITGTYLALPEPFDAALSPKDTRHVTVGEYRSAPTLVSTIAQLRRVEPSAQITDGNFSLGKETTFELYFKKPGDFESDEGLNIISAKEGRYYVQYRSDVEGTSILTESAFITHNGEILGLWGRVLITLLGLVPLILFFTGFNNWWSRRRARPANPKDQNV